MWFGARREVGSSIDLIRAFTEALFYLSQQARKKSREFLKDHRRVLFILAPGKKLDLASKRFIVDQTARRSKQTLLSACIDNAHWYIGFINYDGNGKMEVWARTGTEQTDVWITWSGPLWIATAKKKRIEVIAKEGVF